jgi:broad specificity phosphatase PhoE
VISTIDTGKASPVSEAAAKMAAAWCDYLEDHARRIYHGLIQRDVSTAHRLARKILAGKLVNPFTAREAYRKDWTGLSDGEVIEAGAALLDELGWIKTDRVTAGASGGRPTARYWINPKIARKVD